MRRGAFAAAALLLLLAAAPAAEAAQDKADKVKSVFLFKFFDYATWPSGHTPGASGDGLLCTYGGHNFGDMLDYIAVRKSGDIRFRVRPVGSVGESAACHILYVARGRYGDIARLPPGSGVLTVGDGAGFLEAGGVIQMQEEDGKVRILVDLRNAQKNGIRISSRLLDIAEVRK